jgi:hypothetical protein
VVIHKTDPQTGEPVEKDGKVEESKEGNDDYAFVLRKKVSDSRNVSRHPANSSEIDIVSMDLWNLLKEHLSHYPYHIFRESPVTLSSPYEHIVFQFDELRAETAKLPQDEKDKVARADLELLLDTISSGSSGDEKLDKYFKVRPNCKKQQPEAIQFDDLWTVFPPGMLVYGRPFLGEDQVFVVRDNIDPWIGGGGVDGSNWQLAAWSYDWKDGAFARTEFVLVFTRFDGHLPLTSLPYYPLELHPEKDTVRQTLIDRGKAFRRICEAKEDSRLFEYRGIAVLEKKGFSGMKDDDMVSTLVCYQYYIDPVEGLIIEANELMKQRISQLDSRSFRSLHLSDFARLRLSQHSDAAAPPGRSTYVRTIFSCPATWLPLSI